jgi:integrase
MAPAKLPKGFKYRENKDGTVSVIWHTYVGGKQRKHTSSSYKEAAAAKRKIEMEVERGEYTAPSKLTFADVAERYMAEGPPTRCRVSTQGVYRDQLKYRILPVLGHLRIKDIDEHVLARYFAGYEERYSPRSLDGDRTRIGAVFNFAIRRGLVTKNPVRSLEKHELPRAAVKLDRVLTPDEMTALADSIHPGYYLILMTLAYTGLRTNEARALHWSDIDLDKGTITVSKSLVRGRKGHTDEHEGPPKTEASRRIVQIPDQLVELLREQRENPDAVLATFNLSRRKGVARGRPFPNALYRMMSPPADPRDPYVFYWVTYPRLNYHLRAACKAAGIEKQGAGGNRNHDVTLHTLRHTYGSYMVSAGVDIAAVSRLLGHKSISTTLDTYTHEYNSLRHELEIRAAARQLLISQDQVEVRSPVRQALPAATASAGS